MPSPFIETATGRRFQPLDPVMSEISIEDIAHSLSNQCRFAGFTREHYSIAQHSVHVAELLESWGAPRDVVFWGLMHDTEEGLGIPDLPSPIKNDPEFWFYREAQRLVMSAICRRYDMSPEQPAIVKRADMVMLATEVRDLMPNKSEHWYELFAEYDPLPDHIEPWPIGAGKTRFLFKFRELVK
jgi:hypothetical protein